MNLFLLRAAYFLTLFLISINGFSQEYKLKRHGDFLILKDSTGKVMDSLTVGVKIFPFVFFHYRIDGDIVKVYRLNKFTVPDNCSDFHITEKSYTYTSGKFIITQTEVISFNNSECASYFVEENLYCIWLTKVKVKDGKMFISIVDGEDRKTVIPLALNVFTNKDLLVSFIKQLNKFLLRKECVNVKFK